jgi:hypothetical protein
MKNVPVAIGQREIDFMQYRLISISQIRRE